MAYLGLGGKGDKAGNVGNAHPVGVIRADVADRGGKGGGKGGDMRRDSFKRLKYRLVVLEAGEEIAVRMVERLGLEEVGYRDDRMVRCSRVVHVALNVLSEIEDGTLDIGPTFSFQAVQDLRYSLMAWQQAESVNATMAAESHADVPRQVTGGKQAVQILAMGLRHMLGYGESGGMWIHVLTEDQRLTLCSVVDAWEGRWG